MVANRVQLGQRGQGAGLAGMADLLFGGAVDQLMAFRVLCSPPSAAQQAEGQGAIWRRVVLVISVDGALPYLRLVRRECIAEGLALGDQVNDGAASHEGHELFV